MFIFTFSFSINRFKAAAIDEPIIPAGVVVKKNNIQIYTEWVRNNDLSTYYIYDYDGAQNFANGLFSGGDTFYISSTNQYFTIFEIVTPNGIFQYDLNEGLVTFDVTSVYPSYQIVVTYKSLQQTLSFTSGYLRLHDNMLLESLNPLQYDRAYDSWVENQTGYTYYDGYDAGYLLGQEDYGYYDISNEDWITADDYALLIKELIYLNGIESVSSYVMENSYDYNLGKQAYGYYNSISETYMNSNQSYQLGRSDGINWAYINGFESAGKNPLLSYDWTVYFADHADDMQLSITSFIPGILGSIFAFFFQLASIEVLGISALEILALLVTVAVALLVFKAFFK